MTVILKKKSRQIQIMIAGRLLIISQFTIFKHKELNTLKNSHDIFI